MKFFLLFFYWLHLAAVFGEPEPKCYSRFDYDEKMLLTLLRIEAKVDTFDTRVTDIENNSKRTEVKRISDLQEHMKKTQKILNELESNNTHVMQQYERKTTEITELRNSLNLIKTQMQGLKSVVAFTVTAPVNGPKSGSLSFSNIIINEGNGFIPSTGQF